MKEFVIQELPQLGCELDYFSISGASKRGWTTWLVGAVDPKRVMAIAPVVLDAVNFVAVEHHEFRSYGGWSYALQDYIDMHLTTRFDDPNMILLQQNEDPYFYFDRLTMPKVCLSSSTLLTLHRWLSTQSPTSSNNPMTPTTGGPTSPSQSTS
jgi:PhoPQ-activated pathogenicity-related protein